jgi:hypothetical protein
VNALKTMLIISLGLSSTWAAWQIAPAGTSGMLTGVAYAQEAPKDGAPEELSGPTPEEIEEQLKQIDAAIAREGELKEFKPSEPLSADTAIEMSSEL